MWSQNSEPSGLYCGDESDGDALRICAQVFDSLYNYKVAGLDPVPALATSCDPSTDLKTWTCHLRDGVKFQKGGDLDANDVVDSMAVTVGRQEPEAHRQPRVELVLADAVRRVPEPELRQGRVPDLRRLEARRLTS